MPPCSCGHYFPECGYCGRGVKTEPSQLEQLAEQAGVDPWEYRMDLHDRVDEERQRRLRARVLPGKPPNPTVPEHALDATGGDPLAALDLVLRVREREAA